MASSSPSNYILVDSVEKAEEAIKVLKECKQLSVDCEGVNLGCHGELCLVQVAIPDKVYLFDIVVLKEKVFDLGLKDILEDSSVTKLLYDCRGDSSALKHQYSVDLRGMEDIQLLNTLNLKLGNKRSQCVTGLQKCLDYHLKGCGFSAIQKEKIHKAMDKDNTLWRKRPLSEDFLAYAAKDVCYLSRLRDALYSRMSFHGSRDDLSEVVKYASNRYADFMRNNSAYKRESPYFHNARLPERIIPDVSKVGSKCTFTPFTDATGRKCKSCNWQTDTRPDGQCKRCYFIDHPAEFQLQFQPVARKRRFHFDDDFW